MEQPLDILMTQYKLTNADLVNASTEQLSFKMVSKGRKGRRLTPNVQDKILSALSKVKPELKLRRRDLFIYDIGETVVEQIKNAISQVHSKAIQYPEFIDLLARAGITRYRVEVATNHIIFYGVLGEAHIERGPAISQGSPGRFSEDAIRSAIGDAQRGVIEHSIFLARIHEGGIGTYEVNIRKRRIQYMGTELSYKENIPEAGVQAATFAPKPPKTIVVKKIVKKKRPQKKGMTTKARMSLNKRRFSRKKR